MIKHESNFQTRVSRARIDFELEEYSEAALSYFALAMAEPYNAKVQYNLALCLQRSGRWDAAAEAFERVLALDSDRSDAQLGLGACLLHLDRIEDALESFGEACRGAEQQRACFGKAVALQLLGRFGEARRLYEVLLAADPDSEEILSNLIVMNLEAHDLEEARDHSLRLLEVCPQSAVALQGLASVALDTSDHQSAVSYCDRILEMAPDCLDAWHNLRIAMDRAPSFDEPAFAMHSGRKR